MARIQLIAFDNGVGNSQDFRLLQQALSQGDHQVAVRVISRPERRARRGALRYYWHGLSRRWRQPAPTFDLNLFLEHVYPQALNDARHNVFIPNPEWLDRHDGRWLSYIDALWCKTQLTQTRLSPVGLPCHYLGFMSEDLYLPQVAKLPKFIHLAGKSRMKGTQSLIDCWRVHPHWPTLCIIHSGKLPLHTQGAANIELCAEYLPKDTLQQRLNAHAFHLCTSQTEGWGHYIPEAMSMQAVVITLDAPPMNEHIHADSGVLLAAHQQGYQHWAPLYAFEHAALIAWMESWLQQPTLARYQPLGATARAVFLRQRQAFPLRLNALISALPR